jgi:V-type H+-transporting ATPase subunit G
MTDRVQRLKDAKTEASKEIEALKQEKQAHFVNAEKMNSGSVDSQQSQLNIDTDKKLQEVQAIFNQKKGLVMDKLLATVIDCQPQVHVNAKHEV